MGDKVAARRAAQSVGVPTVPGSDGRVETPEAAIAVVERTGFPVMIKAAAGGGGRGIRVATSQGRIRAADATGVGRGAGGVR